MAPNSSTDFLEDIRPINQIISDDLMWDLTFYINVLACGALAIIGSINNAVNILVFYKLGIKDSMSVYLFGLALTDFVLSFSIVVSRTFKIWFLFFHVDGMDPVDILYVTMAHITDSLFLASGWITTMLSLERCICVTFPFKVKKIFTRNRAIICVALVHMTIAGMLVPLYMTQKLEWIQVDVESVNGTIIPTWHQVMVFTNNRAQIEDFVKFMNVTLIPIPSQVLVLASMVGMVHGLIASSKKRKMMTAVRSENEVSETKLELKTRRLAKVVLFVAIIFFTCSIPRTFAAYLDRLIPDIHISVGTERNTSFFTWQFARFFSVLNASVNFFVYLKINSSYRAKFKEIFSFLFH